MNRVVVCWKSIHEGGGIKVGYWNGKRWLYYNMGGYWNGLFFIEVEGKTTNEQWYEIVNI